MEIECEDGSRIPINYGSEINFGRGLGFAYHDRTVSRKHISFELGSSAVQDRSQCVSDSEFSVNFEVQGKNPVWVFSSGSGGIRVLRNSEKGKMSSGDCFCVSARNPVVFTLKRSGVEGEEEKEERKARVSEEREMAERSQSGDDGESGAEVLGIGSLEVSDLDPAKEFGFVVMGHEFDNYPKRAIRDIKDWDWCLEEAKEDSENDEVTERNGSRGRKNNSKRKKKDEGDADQDWTGESDNERVLITKLKRGKRPKYTTRSRDLNKPIKDSGSRKMLMQKKIIHDNKDKEDDDSDEETLGGFIVNSEVPEEKLADEEEEEEEEDEEEEEEEEDYDDKDDDHDSDDEQINEEDVED